MGNRLEAVSLYGDRAALMLMHHSSGETRLAVTKQGWRTSDRHFHLLVDWL